MFFNPFDNRAMEIHKCTFEIKLGNEIIKKETMEAPIMFIQNQAISLIENLAKDDRPLKVKFYTNQNIDMSGFKEEDRTIINSVEFANNTYKKAFPNEFQ